MSISTGRSIVSTSYSVRSWCLICFGMWWTFISKYLVFPKPMFCGKQKSWDTVTRDQFQCRARLKGRFVWQKCFTNKRQRQITVIAHIAQKCWASTVLNSVLSAISEPRLLGPHSLSQYFWKMVDEFLENQPIQHQHIQWQFRSSFKIREEE